MAAAWLQALASVILVSLISLIGLVALAVDERGLRRAIFVLVSLAVGALFGDAFIHLLPEAFAQGEAAAQNSLYGLAGVFTFFALEKFLRWRHEHPPVSAGAIRPVGYMNLIGDGAHNLIDGLVIGASYLASTPLGIATTIAVVFHEIPQELGDFGVLLFAGFTKGRALFFNFLSATTAILGAVISLLVGANIEGFSALMLPFTAGAFIYIAGSDLIPELHHERAPFRSLVQIVTISAAVGLMLLLKQLE